MKGVAVAILLLVASIIMVVDVSAKRGGSSYRSSSYRAPVRIKVKYPSNRYSTYRAPTYRYTSTGTTVSMSNVPEAIRRRRGGVPSDRKRLLLGIGAVYVGDVVRPSFVKYGESGWKYNGDYDDIAVCDSSTPIVGMDANNRAANFTRFVCPMVWGGENLRYCCGMSTQQNCCSAEQFVRQYASTG